MTKREICERLLILYADVNSLQTQIGVWNEPLDDAERDIRKAILDLAAPETDAEAVERMARADWLRTPNIKPEEKKEPLVLIYEEKGEKTPCPKCGEPAYIIKNAPKIYCKHCADFYPREEEKPKADAPKAEEKHPGVIAKPGKDGEIEWCWCQKCYAQAAVVHDPFGDGENWSYCQKCGVSFRLKREEGEK